MDALADAEGHHGSVGADLLHEAEALDDDVVELSEFVFGEQVEDGEDFGEVGGIGVGHGREDAIRRGRCRGGFSRLRFLREETACKAGTLSRIIHRPPAGTLARDAEIAEKNYCPRSTRRDTKEFKTNSSLSSSCPFVNFVDKMFFSSASLSEGEARGQ
jgi:hypothetical protein